MKINTYKDYVEAVNVLIKHIKAYDNSNPLVEDSIYDQLYRQVISFEAKNSSNILSYSPTQTLMHYNKSVGTKGENAIKIKHYASMLSLQTINSFEEFVIFDTKIKNKLNVNNISYVCEYKIDGLALELIYDKGKLQFASTRGNGYEGENVIKNALMIQSIPSEIDFNDLLVVRGEICVDNDVFTKMNIENKYSNPRNYASGSLLQKDPNITKQRCLRFIAYEIINKVDTTTHFNNLYLLSNYFDIVKFEVILSNTINRNEYSIESFYSETLNVREKLIYSIDGIVVKVFILKNREELGTTLTYPEWAIAWKFPSKTAITKINDIKLSVGRHGVITPIAIFEPTIIDGVTINKATLHNQEFIKEKNIKVGDIVTIKRAGDVIPEVVEVLEDLRSKNSVNSSYYKLPTNCPICISKVNIVKSRFICSNKLCKSTILKSIEHFASKKAMNIEYLGPKTIQTLVKHELIENVADLYLLKLEQLILLNGFSNVSSLNLIKSIQKSKDVDMYRFIYALNILNVGIQTSKLLANKFNCIKDLINSSKVELSCIDNIGDIICDNIYNFFKNKNNLYIIDKLLKYIKIINTYSMNNNNTSYNKFLRNKTFLFTGTLSITREEASKLVENNGGKVVNSISKNIDHVVVGDNPGSKYDKAKQQCLNIIDETCFQQILKG